MEPIRYNMKSIRYNLDLIEKKLRSQYETYDLKDIEKIYWVILPYSNRDKWFEETYKKMLIDDLLRWGNLIELIKLTETMDENEKYDLIHKINTYKYGI